MLNPFNSPSGSFFGNNRMSRMVGASRRAMTGSLIGEINNRGYVSAAKRAHEYRRKNAPKGPSKASQALGAVSTGLGAVASGVSIVAAI